MQRHFKAIATATAVAISIAMMYPSAAAAQTGPTTYYVNNAASASCSDSTIDSVATPYCTIQAAVNAATTPGDAVVVERGQYAPFTVSSSGTATSPITIESTATSIEQEILPPTNSVPTATITEQSAGPAPLTVTGAAYVSIVGFALAAYGNQSDAAISGSSHVTLDTSYLHFASPTAGFTVPGVSISAGSSYVTISRNKIFFESSGGAVVASGGSHDVVTTNLIDGSYRGPGVALENATDSAVTSNTLSAACGAGISVTGGSTTATIENNIVGGLNSSANGCGVADSSATDLLVDSASTSGTIADYNYAYTDPSFPLAPYSWSGTAYTTAAAFHAATGQAAHDSSVTTNSANSDAPGELATDVYGNTRVEVPQVAVTGAGAHPFYGRGAVAVEDPLTETGHASWPALMPSGTTASFPTTLTDGWGYSVTGCTYDFGDGTPAVTVTATSGTCTARHAYATNRNYEISLWVRTSNGANQLQLTVVTVTAPTAFTGSLSATADGGRGVSLTATLNDDWNITSCVFEFGDGTSYRTTPQGYAYIMPSYCEASHTYTRPGTYTVTLMVTDSLGQQLTAKTLFTSSGQYYTPVAPVRILDTRGGSGPVATGGTLRLKVAGVDGVPAGIGAVALNVTVTQPTASGVIIAYADGATRPATSNINFLAGQTISNTVIAQVGADGYVDLANTGSGTTQLIADLQGYYALNGAAGLQMVNPTRLLDTRVSKTTIPAGGTIKVNLGSYAAIAAAAVNVTVTNPTVGGYVVAYPDGVSVPNTSNVNFAAKQTIANEAVVKVGADGYLDFTNTAKGSTDLIVDLTGFFTDAGGAAYVTIPPTRFLDTRNGTGAPYATGLSGGLAGKATGELPIDGNGQYLLSGAAAVTANITVTQPAAGGNLIAYPGSDTSAPSTSTIDFSTGQTIANATTMSLGTGSGIKIYNAAPGLVQLIVDVTGYYN